MTKAQGTIRVGIGGWTFEPWRGTFYPSDLPHKRELEYASRHVTSIEVNGTFYRTQTPDSFAKWHDETPAGFVFSLKAPRYATNRRVLAEAGPSIERFVTSGLLRLGPKLGPINWQFAPTKKFEADDFEAFLKLLPPDHEGTALRHVVELRHPSFAHVEVIDMLRACRIGLVVADSPRYPQLHDQTAAFVYARLQNASEAEPEGYPGALLDLWAKRARAWASGKAPADLPCLAEPHRANGPQDVFIYMINGFKPRAPAAATALIKRLG